MFNDFLLDDIGESFNSTETQSIEASQSATFCSSRCSKGCKYCKCAKSGRLCSNECKCTNCENKERKSLS